MISSWSEVKHSGATSHFYRTARRPRPPQGACRSGSIEERFQEVKTMAEEDFVDLLASHYHEVEANLQKQIVETETVMQKTLD